MSTTNLAVEQLQRVLLPRRGEPADVRSLYLLEADINKERLEWDDRFSVSVPAGAEVSFQTYFNAFPASYWRRWSQLDSVVLKLEITGEARVDLYRSKIDGARIGIDGAVVKDDTVEFEISLAPFEDGGWIWFDLTAETDAQIVEAGWYAPFAPRAQIMPDGSEVGPFEPRVAIGIPTFNRPADAVAALEALASDPAVDAVIDAVLMPDQGNKHPADEPGYQAATEAFGDRFFELRQGNLGGSGGYSRIMFEALGGVDGTGEAGASRSPYILYMDDDIAIEPDSVLRALQAARYAKSPMLIGGQMLNLQERSHLHSMGEVVGRHDFMWTSAPHVHYDHDFSKHPLSDRGNYDDDPDAPNSRDLHRRIDVDYNGWWMCMIPRVVAEKIGQPLPLFIKWDDAEYGLRAKEAGYRTVSLPGVALWHISWLDKDDTQDWQAFFHTRNRVIAGLLHSTRPRGGTLLRNNGRQDIKKLLNMQYYATQLAVDALRSVLEGPDALHGSLARSMPAARERARDFSETRVYRPADEESPVARGGRVLPTLEQEITSPTGARLAWFTLKMLPKHWFRSTGETERLRPELEYPKREAFWWRIPSHTSVLVGTADGSGKMWYHHDRAKFRRLYRESRRLTKIITRRWDQLARDYREALPRITSVEEWNETFEGRGGDTA